MARPIWRGSIAFGLVQIPVDMHVAEEPDELSFRQLDKHDLAPIGYDRINKRTGKKVAWDDIVRGFEYDKDQYVVVSDEELEQANVEATHTIDILAFVDAQEIDQIYFDKPYYLAPSKQSTKAYALLRDTMRRNHQVGIAKIVIRTRQHLAALVAHDAAMMLVTMRFAHELRSAESLAIPKQPVTELGVTKAEIEMANALVRGMHQKWKPEAYKDDYRDDVLALFEKKAKAGELNTVSVPEGDHHASRAAGNVLDLMEMLKRSVARSKPQADGTKKPGPKSVRLAESVRPRKHVAHKRAG